MKTPAPGRFDRVLKGRTESGLDWAAGIICSFVIALYFFWYAADGLRTHFSPDDMQNLYRHWSLGWRQSLLDIVQFWSSSPRPLGALFYLPLFRAAHFNVLPYRIEILCLVILNAVLLFALYGNLLRDLWTRVTAMSLWLFHIALFLVYHNNAIIYDILCFAFYISALLVYSGARTQGRRISFVRLLAIAILYVLALDAKEMAVSLPVTILLFEVFVIQKPPVNWLSRMRELMPAAVLGAMTIAYLLGKLSGEESVTTSAAYQPHVSVDVWTSAITWYTSQLLYHWPSLIGFPIVLLFWAILFALAVLLRSRLALFGLSFAIAALLPVSFIDLRWGYVWYIPLTGVALAMAVLLRRMVEPLPLVRWAIPVVIMGSLLPPRAIRRERENVFFAQATTWSVLQQIKETDLRLPAGSSVLVKDDPFRGFWDMHFILRLYFDDPSLQVTLWSKGEANPKTPLLPVYDTVLIFDGERMIQKRGSIKPP